MLRFTFGVACALAALAFACSSSSSTPLVAIDTATLCDKLVNQCNDTKLGSTDQCTTTFNVFRVSSQCAADLKTASCDDLESSTSKVQSECFPSCSAPHTYTCNLGSGTVTECDPDPNATGVDGGEGPAIQATLDCASVCETESAKYSGTCGTSYQGQTSDHAVCWCN
ncbi:MAG: hypothetical protein ACRELY_05030 [Polyangiaceae bacterium]